MSAFSYLKGATKGVGRATLEVLSEYNSGTTALIKQGKDLSKDLNSAIKDFKDKSNQDKSTSIFTDAQEAGQEYFKNFISDAKSGKWYNTERQAKDEDQLMKDMGFDFSDLDFDFDFDDDFGDLEEVRDNGVSKVAQAEIETNAKSTKAIIGSVDIVGGKISKSISGVSARSAQYIVQAQQESSKALYSLNAKGFETMSTGFASINKNLEQLTALGQPLAAHITASAQFYTMSQDYQNKSLELLKRIADNTDHRSAKGKYNPSKNTVEDMMVDGILDIKTYLGYIKDQFKSMTSIFDMFLGKEGFMGMSRKTMFKQGMNTSSPIMPLLKFFINAIMPKQIRKSSENLNRGMEGFFGSLFDTLRDKSMNGMVSGPVYELFKEFFLPGSQYKRKIDTGNYTKGTVDWDGISRKALVEVIPWQLSQIVAAVTGKPIEKYDYVSGKWKTVGTIKEDYKKFRNSASNSAVGYSRYNINLQNTIDNLYDSKQLTKEQRDAMLKQVENYNSTAFHSDSNYWKNLRNDDFNYKKYGLDKNTWNLMRQYDRKASAADRLEYAGNISRGRVGYGNRVRQLEAEGTSVFNGLFDGSIKDEDKAETLLGADKNSMSVFDYLNGIFANSAYIAENLPYLANGKGYRKARFKGNYVRNDTKSKNSANGDNIEAPEIASENINSAIEQAQGEKYDLKKIKMKKYKEKKEKFLSEYKGSADPSIAFELSDDYDESMEKMIKLNNTLDAAITSIKKFFKIGGDNGGKEDGLFTKITDTIESATQKGTDFYDGFTSAISGSLEKLIFGKSNKRGLLDYLTSEKGPFGIIKNAVGDFFRSFRDKEFNPMDIVSAFTRGFTGTEDEDSKKESLRSKIKRRTTPKAYNGARAITKTGVVAVSKGELIIPAELNPFYHGTVNKQQQKRNEEVAIDNFYGNFANGGTAAPKFRKAKVDNNGTFTGTLKGAGKAVKSMGSEAGSFIGKGVGYIFSGITQVINGIIPNNKKDVDQEKKKMSKLVQATLEDLGAKKGAVAAGALIGGGVSVLTGALIGPILGASLGAASGLIYSSNKVQEALFGKEDKDGKHSGGVITNEKVIKFMQKSLPNMGRGALLGGGAGLFMGSPIAGAIVGSTIGFVNSSEKTQQMLFGTTDKDGNFRGNSIQAFNKHIKDTIKERIPGISAGALAGLVAGPFSMPMNIIIGSTIGYATSSEKFKTWLLGDKDMTTGKRNGGFVSLVKDNIAKPIVSIFHNMTNQITSVISNNFKAMTKRISKRLSRGFKNALKGLSERLGKGSLLGRMLGGIANFSVKDLIGAPLRGLDKGIQKHNLKKGYDVYDVDLNRNMTAEERTARREKYGIKTTGVSASMDTLLSSAKSQEELDALQSRVQMLQDPSKTYREQLTANRASTSSALSNMATVTNKKEIKKIQGYIKKNQYDRALTAIDRSSLTLEERNALKATVDKERMSYDKMNETEAKGDQARQDLLNTAGFKDSGLSKLLGGKNLTDKNLYNLENAINTEKGIKYPGQSTEEKTEKDNHDNIKSGSENISKIVNIIEHIDKIMSEEKGINNASGNASSLFKDMTHTTVFTTPPPTQNKSGGASAISDQRPSNPTEGTAWQDANGISWLYTNGKWEKDNTNSANRAAQKKEDAMQSNFAVLPMLRSIMSHTNKTLGSIKEGLFGSKDKKKKGLLGNLFSFLSGGKSPWAMIAKWFTGTSIGGGIANILSKVTLGNVIANVVGPALLLGGFAGKFDNVAYNLGLGGNANQNITTDKNGNKITKSSNGQYVDANGKTVSTSDIVVRGSDKASFSKNLIKQTIRTGVYGTKGVASAIMSKSAMGKAASKVAQSVATTGLAETIMEGLLKFASALKKIPMLKNMDTDGLIQAIGEKVEKATTSAAGKNLAKFAANAVVFAKIAFIAIDFTTGYEDASTTMKVKNPSTGEKIISGLLRAIKNFIPIIGQLIPDDTLVDIFAKYVAPMLGLSLEEFNKQRKEASDELATYNKENGTNLTWSEYNKQVRHSYTWTERIGNTAKTTFAQGKSKIGKGFASLKKGGVKGSASDIGKSMGSNFKSGYDEMGGGVAGVVNGIGSSFQTFLPGIFGEIPKKNAEILSYALKGKTKEMWAVSFDEFSKTNENEADVGGVSTAIGQVGLLPTKLALTTLAFVMKPINLVLDKVKGFSKAFKSNNTLLTTGLSDMYTFAKAGNPDKVEAYTYNPDTNDPFNGLNSLVFKGGKFLFNIVANIGKWISPISTVISEFGDKVKSFFGIKDKETTPDTGSSSGGGAFVSQRDTRYANKRLGYSTVGKMGCGPAAAVMALNAASGNSMDSAINVANQYQTSGGTDASYFGDYFARNGAKANYYSDKQSMVNSIASGTPTVLMGQDSRNTSKANSPFGPNNHYVVANGLDGAGNLIVNDPELNATKKYSAKILRNVKMGIGVGSGSRLRRFAAGAAAIGSDTGGTYSGASSDRPLYTWNFFKSRGYSDQATAGIMGNMMVESGIDPTKKQYGNGKGRGICQWGGGRLTALKNYASTLGKPWTDLDTQLRWAEIEMKDSSVTFWTSGANTTFDKFKQCKDVREATEDFELAFERAGVANMDRRVAYAKQFYKKYSGSASNSLNGLTENGISTTATKSLASVNISNGDTSSMVDTTATATGETGSSDATTNSTSGLGILSTIISAFSKIGNIFSGSSDTSTTDTSTATNTGTAASDSTGVDNTTAGVGNIVSGNTANINTSGKTAVDYMKSVLGKLTYSMTGPRNPDKGSADCSSTVQWAIKKATGVDIGGNTSAQYNSKALSPIWYKNGQVAGDTLPSNLKPNDILFYKRNGTWNQSYPDRVGHVAIYEGNGQQIGIGSTPGTKEGPVDTSTLIKVSRLAGTSSTSNTSTTSANTTGKRGSYDGMGSGLLSHGSIYSGGASGTESSTLKNTTTGNISKDSIIIMKAMLSLIETLVKNTTKVDSIYDVLSNYCTQVLGDKGVAAAAALQSAKSSSSTDDTVEKSISDLKNTLDQILAS